jgi:hypothetical protein
VGNKRLVLALDGDEILQTSVNLRKIIAIVNTVSSLFDRPWKTGDIRAYVWFKTSVKKIREQHGRRT